MQIVTENWQDRNRTDAELYDKVVAKLKNIKLSQCNSWISYGKKPIQFILSYNLRENSYKLFQKWYIIPSIITKSDKLCNNKCWKCHNKQEHFFRDGGCMNTHTNPHKPTFTQKFNVKYKYIVCSQQLGKSEKGGKNVLLEKIPIIF